MFHHDEIFFVEIKKQCDLSNVKLETFMNQVIQRIHFTKCTHRYKRIDLFDNTEKQIKITTNTEINL